MAAPASMLSVDETVSHPRQGPSGDGSYTQMSCGS